MSLAHAHFSLSFYYNLPLPLLGLFSLRLHVIAFYEIGLHNLLRFVSCIIMYCRKYI